MSNNPSRRIKRRHQRDVIAGVIAQRTPVLLAEVKAEGCTCDPFVVPPWESPTGDWITVHDEQCPWLAIEGNECPCCEHEHQEHERLTALVLAELRDEGCTCEPIIQIPVDGNRILVSHDLGCPQDSDDTDRCLECLVQGLSHK